MSGAGRDALGSFLFASDFALVNLKLMRGDSQDVTEHALRNEVQSALMQAKTGSVTSFKDFPDVGNEFHLNVDELAAGF